MSLAYLVFSWFLKDKLPFFLHRMGEGEAFVAPLVTESFPLLVARDQNWILSQILGGLLRTLVILEFR